MARFYANENFPLPVVEELRRRGHDTVTIAETGDETMWQLMTKQEFIYPANSDDLKFWRPYGYGYQMEQSPNLLGKFRGRFKG